ncbi:MAG: TetR family transcriptional regulator [Bacteroidetes bacterium RIFCSPHIGHO2_02_FULL_44_7]|nr:MAG: TetR family transcriptional regulator [Bacteroidetes bacterium RIFCSPHIGHO2_02_FULL_44_7]
MERLTVNINVSNTLFLRDPDASSLGRKIVSESINLINDLGFEAFTFKKLGERIGSPESSIYRYFESKHALLTYLVSWYWGWVEYRLTFAIANIEDPHEQLRRAISVLVDPITEDTSISHINEVLLNKIIISESFKAYHIKEVDYQNEKGCFRKLKQVVQHVSDLVLKVNPEYNYPHILISTLIEGVHHQRYFAEHLPSLTDTTEELDSISDFYHQLVFKAIK